MSEDLKACPFCGNEMNDDNFFSCDGYPQACGCWEQTHTAQEAVDVWNHRPIEDALREENKKLKDALAEIVRNSKSDELPDGLEIWECRLIAQEALK